MTIRAFVVPVNGLPLPRVEHAEGATRSSTMPIRMSNNRMSMPQNYLRISMRAFLLHHPMRAITSISTSTALGSPAACTVALAGR